LLKILHSFNSFGISGDFFTYSYFNIFKELCSVFR